MSNYATLDRVSLALLACVSAMFLMAAGCGGSSGKNTGQVADDILREIARYEGRSANNLDDIRRALKAASIRSEQSQVSLADDWLRAAQQKPAPAARIETIATGRTLGDILNESAAQDVVEGTLCQSVLYLLENGYPPSLEIIGSYIFDEFVARGIRNQSAQDAASDIYALVTELDADVSGSARIEFAKFIYC